MIIREGSPGDEVKLRGKVFVKEVGFKQRVKERVMDEQRDEIKQEGVIDEGIG